MFKLDVGEIVVQITLIFAKNVRDIQALDISFVEGMK